MIDENENTTVEGNESRLTGDAEVEHKFREKDHDYGAIKELKDYARSTAYYLTEMLPDSPERQMAIMKLEEVVFLARSGLGKE